MYIDYKLTESAFHELGLTDFSAIYTQNQQEVLFHNFEMGHTSQAAFISEIQRIMDNGVDEENILKAWNAMLLDFPRHRFDLLKSLKSKYKLFLVSNTNEIHFNAFNEIFENTFSNNFSDMFDKDYYSHIMRLRKPNSDIFEHILEKQSLKREETLFIDDTQEHVDAARKLALPALLLKNEDVSDLLLRIGLLT